MARLDGAGDQLDQRGDDVEVEAARVDLPDAGQHPLEAEVGGDPLLERGELVRVAVEEVEHVLRGADRALDAAQGIARDELLEALVGDQQLVGDRREALAQRGRLGGDVVRAAGHHEGLVLGGEPGETGQRRDRPDAEQPQRGQHLELLDVLGEVARGHALVDVLVPGEGGELLDPRLHVVPGHPLPRRDAVEVDLVDDLLVGLDDAVGHVDAEVALGLQHRDPEPALEHDLVLGRPDRGEVGAGVAAGEDVGVGHLRLLRRCRCGGGPRRCAIRSTPSYARARASAT